MFDNGRGLFPNVQDGQLDDAAMLAALSWPASGGDSFEQAASRVMGDRQLAVLETMAGFEFDLEKLPSSLHARARALEPFLRARVTELARLEPVDRMELARACDAWRARNA